VGEPAWPVHSRQEDPILTSAQPLMPSCAINNSSRAGKTALMVAVENGHLETARQLILLGASVNDQDERGATALMFASQNGWMELVLLLLDHDADVAVKDGDGVDAMWRAAAHGHSAIVKQLVAGSAGVGLLGDGDTHAVSVTGADELPDTGADAEDAELAAALAQIEELDGRGCIDAVTTKPREDEPLVPAGHWMCSTCTLVNPNLKWQCDACGARHVATTSVLASSVRPPVPSYNNQPGSTVCNYLDPRVSKKVRQPRKGRR